MKREFITPKGDWHRFENDGEKLQFLKKVGLTPKSFNAPKQTHYRGVFADQPVTCDVVGYVDHDIAVIEIDTAFHCIAVEHLVEMQLSKKELQHYGLEQR